LGGRPERELCQIQRFQECDPNLGVFPSEEAVVSRIRYPKIYAEVFEYKDLLCRDDRMVSLVPLCEEVLHYLAQPAVAEAIASEQRVSAFVHGDYNYPNLIKDSHHKLHLIDFENTSLNVRMNDLSHILHRNCLWDSSRMLRWIEYYERKRPLSPYDLNLLHAQLMAPYHVVRNIRIGGFRHAESVIPTSSRLSRYRRELRALL
jgi:thiamine kinase-like enzyme